jgi:hypothetical protein
MDEMTTIDPVVRVEHDYTKNSLEINNRPVDDEAERRGGFVLTGIELGLDPVFGGRLRGVENTENVSLVCKTTTGYISPIVMNSRPSELRRSGLHMTRQREILRRGSVIRRRVRRSGRESSLQSNSSAPTSRASLTIATPAF